MNEPNGNPEFLSAFVAALIDTGGFVFSVYLIRHNGKLMLPGGPKEAMDAGRILTTAMRVLKKQTSIEAGEEALRLVTVLDGCILDAHGNRHTSIVYETELLPSQHRGAHANDDGDELILIPLARVPIDEMTLDHARAIHALRKTYI